VISDAIVKVNLAFAEHTSDDWLHAVRRLNAGCTARRGLILLIRYRVPIGSATSTLVQRGADRRRRRQASARFGSQSGACRTRNRPFPDRRLAASRRRIRLRVGDSRRDRRVACAQAAPAGSSAKPAPEKNTQHFPLRGNTMRAPGVEQYACRS
jgi:hypothetical protein